ncbi:polyphenol oxidase family protein, partial [Candidatus Peregrinibacteria bacterium]|nr:polyphenol oxidase family protein [Candidatus Peregrinibacteria bacterium]
RGTIQNIVGKTISGMIRAFSSLAEDILVAVGPSLGPCHSQFLEREKDFRGFEPYFLDNSRVNLLAITRHQLREVGIRPSHMELSDICTVCRHDLYFSFRGDKPDCGRFASVIGVLR